MTTSNNIGKIKFLIRLYDVANKIILIFYKIDDFYNEADKYTKN